MRICLFCSLENQTTVLKISGITSLAKQTEIQMNQGITDNQIEPNSSGN